jgi:alpha-D-ribose 1-methylphosphonate 5-triphosphate synthase subunit PhnL
LRPRPRISALEVITEPLLASMGYDDALEQSAAMLVNFGLKEDLWDAYPMTFSGGEQQKVNLARALIARVNCFCWMNRPHHSICKRANR